MNDAARVALALACVFTLRAAAFGPAAHAYIASRVLGDKEPLAGFAAAVPDLNGLLRKLPGADARMKMLGHYEFERLCGSLFAAGFATHNNVWGADSVAHAYFVPGAPDNYVTEKLRSLSAQAGITMHEAEDLFDAAIDMTLAREVGPALGQSLAMGAQASGAAEEQAMVAAFSAPLAEAAQEPVEVAETQLRWSLRCMKATLTAYGTLLQGDLNRQRPAANYLVGRVFNWSYADARAHLDTALALAQDCRPAMDAIAVQIRQRMLASHGYAGYVVP